MGRGSSKGFRVALKCQSVTGPTRSYCTDTPEPTTTFRYTPKVWGRAGGALEGASSRAGGATDNEVSTLHPRPISLSAPSGDKHAARVCAALEAGSRHVPPTQTVLDRRVSACWLCRDFESPA